MTLPIHADFETILPLIGAIFSFSFGVFVWLKEPRKDVNLLFLGFCTAITYWLVGTFQMFANRMDVEAAIFWDRFVYIGVVFVPSLMHHFSLAITGIRGQRKLLAMSYAFSVFFLVASRTDWFVSGLNVFPHLVHSKAMFGHHIFLALFFLDASLLFVNLYRASKEADAETKKVYAFTAAAFINILLIGGTAYLPAYGIDIGYPFSYFSGIIFVILLSVAVARYGFLEVRVLAAELFTFIVGLVFVADMILSKNVGELMFSVLALLTFAYFGMRTIRTMREEVTRRLEIQALARKLEDSNLHLKRMDEIKNEFISIASHQLRTPITVMKGYMSLMLEGAYGKLTPSLREKVTNMNLMNERLVQMINNMLNISRIERGSVDYACAPMDVFPVIGRVAEELAPKAGLKGITIRVDGTDGGPVEAFADPEKLAEVLSNLVDNAVKYSAGGTIAVGAYLQPKKKAAVITVSDEGLGMSQDDVQKVFQKFFRSKNPGIMSQGGTGLGLYVCAMFIRGMGGDIWVEKTAPSKGTTFAFALPIEAGGKCVAPSHRMA